MKKLMTALAALSMAVASMSAQEADFSYYLPDTCNYDKAIPRPSEVLGFEVGEFAALHGQIISYFKEVAAVSDRVKLINYGRTCERKPLYLAIVSTPENLRNLDAIKAEHDRIADPKENVAITDDTPVFTWLGHTIHGNEITGTNATMLLLYHLAAAQNAETLGWLEHSIIIIDPANNPDGIDRFSEWVNQNRSEVPNNDTQEREHLEDWPRGRFNHYLFDLNRDWLNQQQPESRARAEQILEWHPNVYTCSHEQGTNNNFHFSPGVPSRVHPLIMDECMELIGKLASDYYAPAFDKQKMMYFSGEVYDDYYIGRGREYFDFHGGLALLWEQGSPRGFLQHTDNGDLPFSLGIHNQLTMELSTIRGCCEMRRELNEYQKEFYRRSYKEGQADKGGNYVFGSKDDFASAVRFAEVVKRNGIEVYKLGKDISVDGVRYVKDSAFVVPLAQKTYRLIQGIFEVRKEYADSVSYDITGWTMPMSFNLDCCQAKGVSLGEAYDYGKPFIASIIGAQDPEKVYAYAFEWSGFYAPRALYRLQKAGVYVKVASDGLSADGRTFGRGSIFVPMGEVYQKLSTAAVKAVVDEIVGEDMIDVYALESGYSKGHNVGSPTLMPVKTPEIAILAGSGANATSVGALWNLLDRQYRIKASLIPADRVESLDLARYNVIFVCGNFPQMSGKGQAKIKAWTAAGNTLVATESALAFINKAGITDIKAKPAVTDRTVPYGDFAVVARSQNIPGVILGSKMDITHPLCWGYSSEDLPVFKNNAVILENIEGNTLRTPILHSDPALLSGNMVGSVQKRVAGTPVEVVTKVGDGRCIYLTVDAAFRGIWYGTSKLFANAIFFGDKVSPYTL